MSDAGEAGKTGGVFETRADAGKGASGLVRLWMTAIRLASEDEKDWRKAADDASRIYRGAAEQRQQVAFNILYSNTETIRSAVYNSPPIPDVRRRYGDDDEAGRVAGQVVERALFYAIDTHDFNGEIKAAVKDAALVGRGVTRVRYAPMLDADQGTAYERVMTEHVQWADFRRGPGRRWTDVPWIAFRHLLTREQVIELSPRVGATVPLDMRSDGAEVKAGKDDEPSDVFKRLLVWEVWDKDKREVLFIAPSWSEGPLAREADPLKLEGFWPIPRPLMAIEATDSLIPVEPYRLYKTQAEELDTVTRRINAIVKVIKWRGIRAGGSNDGAMQRLMDASDGELVPAEDAIAFATQNGLDKSIWMMPIEQAIAVVTQLYEARERIKQTIYEITGIADILRGATEAQETATAQQIKAQWGSLRIQDLQAEAARHARDLIRLMAEIICTRFDWQTLSEMTQTNLPTMQQKQAMQAMLQQQASAAPAPQQVAA